MFRPKYQQKLTLAFVVLASALILFAEPVFAKKAAKSRKSGESTQAKQQASKPAPAPKARQSSNASRNRSSAASNSRSSQPRANSSSSINRNNTRRTPSVRQPSRTTTSRTSTLVTSSRISPSRPTTSSNTRKPTSIRIGTSNPSRPSSSGSRQSTNSTNWVRTRPSSATKQPAVSSNNRISSSKSSRIGNSIGTQPQSTSTVHNQSTKSSTNRISSRIGSTFSTEQTLPPTVARQPAASLNNRISSSKRPGIGNMIGNQLTSTSRTRKQSIISSTNRNKSLIDSVKSPDRTPPSNVAKQPAGSSNNRISSRDRADSRIGSVIGPKRTPPPNVAKRPAASLNNRRSSNIGRDIGNSISKQTDSKTRTKKQLKINQGSRDNTRLSDKIRENRPSETIKGGRARDGETVTGSRIIKGTNSGRANRKANSDTQTTIINNTIVNTSDRRTGTRVHRFNTVRPSRLIYRDRPHFRRDRYHYEHTYVDHYSRLRRRIIWPRYRFTLCYNRGPWFSFRHVYPYYHRKYLFVSLGGYWPLEYSYIRYYWYGCHPYSWYGYYPIAREVKGETYNYYTYNYYYGDNSQSPEPMADAGFYEKLAQQPAEEPSQATLADSYFEEAVEAFEASNYDIAVDKFAKAMEFAPNDMVLPFAYCQALLATEQYSKAAEVLRTALTKISPEKEGVFYPRGLYPDEEILLAQLDDLAEKVEIFNFDADLQLLLGYQLLGIGQLDKAVTPLMNAGRDLESADAAAVLLRLLEKIKTSEDETEETEEVEIEKTEIEEAEKTETEGVKIDDTDASQSSIQSKIINKGHATRTKGTVLLATLCVLAGSTGIGHYFRV